MQPWSVIHNFRQDIYICKLPWWNCSCDWAEKARRYELTPDTKQTIAGYPGISAEDARLIFIRNRGREDWKNRSIDFQELITNANPVKDIPREQVINHINFLHTMIRELKAYAQGLEIEYAKEIEPEIEASHVKREGAKDAKRSSPRTIEGMIARSGMTREALLAAITKKLAADKTKV